MVGLRISVFGDDGQLWARLLTLLPPISTAAKADL